MKNPYERVEVNNIKQFEKYYVFNVILYPTTEKIMRCKYFRREDNKGWISFPQFDIPPKEGSTEKEWIPYISHVNKEIKEALNKMIVEALEIELNKENSNGTKKDTKRSTYPAKKATVEIDPSSVPF